MWMQQFNCWIVYDKNQGKFALTQFGAELENRARNFTIFDRRSRTVSPEQEDTKMGDA